MTDLAKSPLSVGQIQRDEVIRAVAAGASFTGACTAVGIDPSHIGRWLRKGNEMIARIDAALIDDEEYDVPVHLLPLVEFVHDLERAKQQGTLVWLEQIAAHHEKDWRAPAWLLERTRGEEFAAPEKQRLRANAPDRTVDASGTDAITTALDRVAEILERRAIVDAIETTATVA